jgi:hypothetical protein
MTGDHMLRLIYLEALSALYEAGGSLSADPQTLSDELLLPVEEIARCLPILDGIARAGSGRGGLLMENGQISNGRVSADLLEEQAFRAKQAEHGSRGGAMAGKGRPKGSQGSVRGTPNPPSPSPSPPPLPSPITFPTTETELRLTAQAPKPKLANWVGEACQIWEAIGTPNAGRIGKALKPLVDKHGWEAVKPVWQLECGSKTTESARFFSPQKFAETFAVSLKAFQERQPERKRETWSEMRARLDAAGVGA